MQFQILHMSVDICQQNHVIKLFTTDKYQVLGKLNIVKTLIVGVLKPHNVLSNIRISLD